MDLKRDHPNDLRAIFDTFEKAAATGYPEAQVAMAHMIEAGKLMRPDHERALQLMRAAAGADDSEGHFALGLMYSVGIGEPRNARDTAIYHIRCAAQAGETSAMNELASRYRTGYTVPKDFLRATVIFVDAASNTYGAFSDASFRLQATEPDADRFNHVVDLTVAALIRSDANAFATLGEMHAQGDYGQTNLVRAAALFDLAAANGNKASGSKRDQLISTFTPDQKSQFRDELKWMKAIPERRMNR
jgi:TPR repeat protein